MLHAHTLATRTHVTVVPDRNEYKLRPTPSVMISKARPAVSKRTFLNLLPKISTESWSQGRANLRARDLALP